MKISLRDMSVPVTAIPLSKLPSIATENPNKHIRQYFVSVY